MFGASNPFGQGSNSSSPFGSQTQSVFGQNNNAASNNPFAPKPFGASSPFGAQTGGSMFGGTSTGVFGQPQASSPFGGQTGGSLFGGTSTGVFGQPQASSPFGAQTGGSMFGGTSTGVFGQAQASSPFGAQTGGSVFGGTSTGVFGQAQASSPFGASSQGFGSSTPSFGAPSAPAFGNSPSPFGGTSTFGQNNGFSMPQSSPFGSTTQQSQPAFGNSTFGSSTPFGAPTTPAFGSTNTSAFGASSTSAFGASSSPAFGAAPTPAFGNSGNAFGNNAFGSGGAFGTPSSAFGASSTSAFGVSSSPAFGVSNSPAFGSGSSPAFGQSPFGAQGTQTSNQQGGSRVMPYASTIEADSTGNPGKLQSISAMTVHKDKCHEELRWEDFQRGDKGGKLPAGQNSVFSQTPTNPFGQPSTNPTHAFQSTIASNPNPNPNPFGQTPANPTSAFQSTISPNPNPFGQTPANPTPAFQSTISPNPNPFGQTPANPTNPFQTTQNPFSQNTPATDTNFSSPFGQPTTPSLFSSNTTSGFGSSSGFATTTTQPFGPSSTPSFASSSAFSSFNSSPSLFSSTPAQGSTPAFSSGNFNSSQSAPLFSSNPSFAQTSSGFGPSTNAQPSIFSTPSTGFPNMSTSFPSFNTSISPFSQTKPAGLTPQQSTQPTQPSFTFNNSGQTQASGSAFCPVNFGQVPATQPNPVSNFTATQPNPVASPFGTLPAMPQISIGQGGNSPSIQYGISSLPVVDRPAPARVSPLLTSRHLLQRRVMLPPRKYRPGDDSPKVAFFSDEENSDTPKADAFFNRRENPRALFIRSFKKETAAPLKDETTPLQENGKRSNGVIANEANNENKNNGEVHDALPVKANEKLNVAHENHGGDKNSSKSSPSRAEIESLLPKLHHAEYFTEPRIQELAAKERANPGYTGRVRNFVVGRHGYGSIKFLGETDVRKLDLEKLVQFNNREVLVYMDERQKPPVGQGLNKPAEVTLLNIKCMDKNSGKQVKEGPRVEKYKEMLKRKAEEQGAQFVSFDAVNGEWKFRVEHF